MNRRRIGRMPSLRLGFSGSSLLRDAVLDNDANFTKELLSSRNRLKITSLDVNESLLKACKYGNISCVEVLLKSDIVHVDHQDEDLWTSLHMAAASSHNDIVQLLIQFKADPTLLDIDGHFALDYATDERIKDSILNDMAKNGVHIEDLPSIKSRLPRAMLAAVASGIRRNKDLTAYNKNGVSPLHTAAANGYIDILEMLIESGINFECHDNDGFTPLYVALKYHQIEAARLLVSFGANTTDIDSNMLSLLDTNQQQVLYNPYTSRLAKSKLSNIAREDRQKEGIQLKQSGYADQVQDKQMAILMALSFDSTLPEMIYDSVETIEDEYDTFGNTRKLTVISNSNSINSNSGYNHTTNNDDDDLYDDAIAIRQSMNINNNGAQNDYDDASIVRQSMGLSTTSLHNGAQNDYDDASSVRQSMGLSDNNNSSQLCNDDELYDDTTSVRQSMVKLDNDDELYDDTTSVRQSMVKLDNDDELYDDTTSVRQSMVKLDNDDELYDDTTSVRQSMVKLDNDDELYDDTTSVRQSMVKLDNDDELYDDTTSVRQSMVKLDNDDELYDDTVAIKQAMSIETSNNNDDVIESLNNSNTDDTIDECLYDDASSVINKESSITVVDNKDIKYVPQPYESVKMRSKNIKVEESIYSSIAKRKTTTRRRKLPSSVSTLKPAASAMKNGHPPLVSSVSSDHIPPVLKPLRLPDRRLSEQVTVLSPNVPIAWQYRLAAKTNQISRSPPSSEPNYKHHQSPSPVHSSVYHEIIANGVSPLRTRQVPNNNNSLSPITPVSTPSPNPQLIIPSEYSVSTPYTPPPITPTYMTIPEQRDIYSSFESFNDSGEYSAPRQSPPPPPPSTNSNNRGSVIPTVIQSGITKMKLANRLSVPVQQAPPIPARKRVSMFTNSESSAPKPLQLPNPFI